MHFFLFVVVCCSCHLASIETSVDFDISDINSRWADSHYVKLIGIKGNRMLGERWDNLFSLSLRVCCCFCLWYVFDYKFTVMLSNNKTCFFLFLTLDLTLSIKKFCLWCLNKINAPTRHLIDISVQRAFIVKGLAIREKKKKHWLPCDPGRPGRLPGIYNHCSMPWKTDAPVQS